jgi:hypothetical protein
MLKTILPYKAILLGPLITGHFIYTSLTSNNTDIRVKNKYKYVKAGFTHFMIVDTNDIHYNIHNSFWYGKWDAVEDWTNINVGEHLRIKYYGFRAPLFGMFPNVVDTKHDIELDKMKSKIFAEKLQDQLVNSSASINIGR